MAAILACIFKASDVPQRKRAAVPVPRAQSRPNPLPRIETPRVENQTGPRQYRVSQSQAYSPTTTAPARSAVPPQRKTSKFWFLKPGALPATVAEGSPYHTIHVASTSRDNDGGGASPKKPDQRSSSSAKRRKKKTSASGSIAYLAQQAVAPPPPPPPTLLNKAILE